MNFSSKCEIKSGYIPGAIGRVTELHGRYYHDNWNFGVYFESKVACELSAFMNRFNPENDGIWFAVVNGRILGSIVIDGIHASEKGAHLRWFIVSDALKGYGRKLITQAIHFCSTRRYKKIYLWTFKGLDTARHLYEDCGFKLIKQKKGAQWGTEVIEQYFELNRI